VEVTIRRGVADDIPVLLDFWTIAGENASRPSDDAALIENLLERDPESLLIAELDGAIVGTVIAGWDGWRAHLYRLAVDPGSRGQGIGRLLVEAAEKRLRALERSDSTQWCFRRMPSAGAHGKRWAAGRRTTGSAGSGSPARACSPASHESWLADGSPCRNVVEFRFNV
jgi:GNAT superfamily N-acetyltransferase